MSPSYISLPFLSFSPVYCPTVSGTTRHQYSVLKYSSQNSTTSPTMTSLPIREPYTHSPVSINFPRNLISLTSHSPFLTILLFALIQTHLSRYRCYVRSPIACISQPP